MTTTIAIYLFPDVEVLDFAGPYEVFTTASRVHGRRNPGAQALFRVVTVAAHGGLVRARAGLEVRPDHQLADHPALDVLVVPGGVINAELDHAQAIDWIARQSRSGVLTASVCTGAFLLAKAGLLAGKSATTHWEDIDEMRSMFPEVTVEANRRWLDLGSLVTSAGISAGIDMSLHLVERLAGRELALATARQMDIDWHEDA